MTKLTKNQVIKKFKKIQVETPISNYQDLVVAPNQRFTLQSTNSHFPSVTLNSGSIFEISNINYIDIPFRLEIGRLILKPNGPASKMSFFDTSQLDIDGDDGDQGPNGNNAYRRTRGNVLVEATPGGIGESGGDGSTIIHRGILYLSIQEIIVEPNAPLTKAIFSLDGNGPKGGDGGNGGNGGYGGNGVAGRSGRHDCDAFGCRCTRGILSGSAGTNGGSGGLPGNGGNGGNGATISFFGPTLVFNQILSIVEVEGGKGGKGGRGGYGGNGGNGAASVRGGGGHCGRRHPAKPPGRLGEDQSNLTGNNGLNGDDGSIKKIESVPTYENIINEIISRLEKN